MTSWTEFVGGRSSVEDTTIQTPISTTTPVRNRAPGTLPKVTAASSSSSSPPSVPPPSPSPLGERLDSSSFASSSNSGGGSSTSLCFSHNTDNITHSFGSRSNSHSNYRYAPTVDVTRVEDTFLSGDFADALTLANRCLKQQHCWSNVNSHFDSTTTAWPLITPIQILPSTPPSTSPRYIAIHFHKDYPHPVSNSKKNHPDTDTTNRGFLPGTKTKDRNNSTTAADRAAAIALQSWYELTQQSRNGDEKCCTPTNTAMTFLQPFLDTYTTTAPGDVLGQPRVMSLELFIVWVSFLMHAFSSSHAAVASTTTTTTAIGLAVEVMRLIRSSSTTTSARWGKNASLTTTPCIPPDGQAACHELVVLLFTQWLPLYNNETCTTIDWLNRLRGEMPQPTPIVDNAISSSSSGQRIHEPLKKTLQLCLCFCNTDEGNWPHWIRDAFVECRVQLQAQLQEMHRHQQHQGGIAMTDASLVESSRDTEAIHEMSTMGASAEGLCGPLRERLCHPMLPYWTETVLNQTYCMVTDQWRRLYSLLELHKNGTTHHDGTVVGQQWLCGNKRQQAQILALTVALLYIWRNRLLRSNTRLSVSTTLAVWKAAWNIRTRWRVTTTR